MATIEELRRVREEKMEKLKIAGMEPYPVSVPRDCSLAELRGMFTEKEAAGDPVSVAGRVMAIRGQGAILFAVLNDGTDTFQAVFKKDELPSDVFDLWSEAVDIGDIVSVTGTVFTTNRGEQSVLAKDWVMAAKSLLPLPEKWHGITDPDERFRKRYLDILFNDDVRDVIEKRSRFWNAVRKFHLDRGFVEVETPVLEVTTGGADAKPFATHHDALDMDVYLRISVGELWQKRLMVAGVPKTFEIGRVFRNEGMSAEHAQDYSQCEAYWAYASANEMKDFLRECYQFAAQETFGTLQFSIRGHDVDLSGTWPSIDYAGEIREKTGIDIWTADEDAMETTLRELGIEFEKGNRNRLVDTLWKHCRKQIIGPAILVNEPTFMSPLAKKDPANPEVVQRFHFIIAGSEVGQGYSELNDPIDQRQRFEEQQALREAGDEEAQMADWEFVEALEHGMPPTAGHGFSERLLAFLLDKPIREAQLFPLMRPRE